ncbi:MAG: hypothetical protein AAF108_12275 [Planctomycetota bacterium]
MTETATTFETAPEPDVAPDVTTPPSGPAEADKLVPVSEAIRYRKRAQTAEQQLGELRDRFTRLQSQLDDSRQTITSLERRQKIDALLTDSNAIDLEAARLLTEISVSQMDEPDVASAVNELRRQKPYLFRRPRGTIDSAMAPHVDPPAPERLAAERAAVTGDRRDLLDYLRLRRR